MIETDIAAALIADASINAIISGRIFNRNPIDQQTQTYITFDRPTKQRDMVRDRHQFRFFIYSENIDTIETLAQLLIDFFEDKTSLNGNEYYKIAFLGQSDPNVMLENGFYYSLLQFQFDETT